MRGGERSPGINRPAVTVSIMLATIMQGVDNTIANVALPHIQGSLSASQDQVAWVVTSYIVPAAIMMGFAPLNPSYALAPLEINLRITGQTGGLPIEFPIS